jgi:osmotically inducible protein OsmC
MLSEAHLTADSIETTADVTLTKAPDGFSISAVHLVMKASRPSRS